MPGISLDTVLLGYSESQILVLLLKFRDSSSWALPGGFLSKDSEMDEAISDVLYQRTGLRRIFLKQFHTFSSATRTWAHGHINRSTFKLIKKNWKEEDREELEAWFSQRFVSTAYFALVDIHSVNPEPDQFSDACQWFPIDQLPELVLDHKEIIEYSLRYLGMQSNYLPIGLELLPPKFTMIDLQSIYEAVLGRSFDRGNFQRKILKLNILRRHEKQMSGASNKAPYLYSFDKKAYKQLLKKGISFI